jgi:4-hydroxybenzoate polyprenyltransferase
MAFIRNNVRLFSSVQPPKTFSEQIDPYLRLARVQRQIGTHLLLLPCFWGIALGAPGYIPPLSTMALFSVGALGCRSAGCIINDFADRDIDKHVDRTKARPLTTGELSPK